MEASQFKFPWQYSFPPFFTPQPNLDTRAKQIEAWKTLILDFHKAHKIYILDVTEAQSSELFCNQQLQRKLGLDMVYEILDELKKSGNVEWIDKTRQRCYVYWRTPDEWGKLIHQWAVSSGLSNSVCTLFEIANGDDAVGQEFFGLDNGLLKKALATLEKEGLAELILDPENEGVKFF